MSALLSFLGGSAFRAIWGEASTAWNKHQDHKHEVEMRRLDAELESVRHKRELELQESMARLGIQTIEAKADADIGVIEADAWRGRVKDVERKTGVKALDVWRMSIQPALASIAILLWVSSMSANGFKMTDWDREIVGAVLGMYLANRHLTSRGK